MSVSLTSCLAVGLLGHFQCQANNILHVGHTYTASQQRKTILLLFITLADFHNSFIFGFSKKFAIKPLSCFPLHINCVATLPCELKIPLLSFYTYSCYKNLHRNSCIISLNVIDIIWHVLPVTSELVIWTTRHTTYFWLNSNCLSCVRSVVSSLSSSETMCQLNECAQSSGQCLTLQTSEMGDSHVYFIRSIAPRSEPSELQNLHRNSAAGLPQKNS